MTTVTTTDEEALQRSLEIAMRDPLRAELLQAKLADEEWHEVADFAACSCQIDSLSLKPWEDPPANIDENADDEPDGGEREPNTAARKLLRRMLAAGISRYEPDPLTALKRRKRKK